MDGGIDGLQHIGQSADVILVSVGDKEATELLLVLGKVGHIGDHQIHAVHIVLGKAQAAVDDDHILAILQDGEILSDLVETAQRDDL